MARKTETSSSQPVRLSSGEISAWKIKQRFNIIGWLKNKKRRNAARRRLEKVVADDI